MTSYNVVAETTIKPTLPDDVVDDVMDGLADHHGVLGRNERGRIDVILTVTADSLRQAAVTGLAVAEAALGRHGKIASLEVMTSAEFDARYDAAAPPPMPELVTITEAAAELGVSRQAVHQRIESGSLPATRVGSTWVIPKVSLRPSLLEAAVKRVVDELGPDATARDALQRAERLARERHTSPAG